MKIRNIELSKTSTLHYYKLFVRGTVFLIMLILYIFRRMQGVVDAFFSGKTFYNVVLFVVWLIILVEMVLRFFPSDIESMGCQKQFKKNYKKPATISKEPPDDRKATIAIALSWFALNGLFGVLYFTGIVDKSFLVLVALFYALSDMICILFFCPFQTLYLKNKCCNTCRIYNWDYAMMCTPLIFMPHWFTWSLVVLSIALLIRWEWDYHVHHERFYEETNDCLKCRYCEEKLCTHKTQLQHLHRTWARKVQEQAEVAKAKAAETAEIAKAKATETAEMAKAKATETAEKAKVAAADASEKAKHVAADAADKAKHVANDAADKLKHKK